MRKIRVNELARELEVKPGVILELLPQLGVHEKKTHSSSLDEEVSRIAATAWSEGGNRSEYSNGHPRYHIRRQHPSTDTRLSRSPARSSPGS